MSIRDDVDDLRKEVDIVKEIKKQSLAKELLEDYKKQNKRLFIIIIVISILWFITGVYLVYILNDIGTTETTTKTQEISDVDNVENTNIVNGDMNGKDKAND